MKCSRYKELMECGILLRYYWHGDLAQATTKSKCSLLLSIVFIWPILGWKFYIYVKFVLHCHRIQTVHSMNTDTSFIELRLFVPPEKKENNRPCPPPSCMIHAVHSTPSLNEDNNMLSLTWIINFYADKFILPRLCLLGVWAGTGLLWEMEEFYYCLG